MDPWLTDTVKELLFKPCMDVAEHIGHRLDNRVTMGQSMDERALTEDLVDGLDTQSTMSAWGTALWSLQNEGISVRASVRKSTTEWKTGADLGITVNRQVYQADAQSVARYACLVQCKKIDGDGGVSGFFHRVDSSERHQSELMLDITPSSYYFLFTPPSLLRSYCTFEPLAFISARQGCSSPVWNIGSFGYGPASTLSHFLSVSDMRRVCSILVVPALSVDADRLKKPRANIADLLPNCLPFWYWFGELLIPGFVGDPRDAVVAVATNVRSPDGELSVESQGPGVNFSVEVSLARG